MKGSAEILKNESLVNQSIFQYERVLQSLQKMELVIGTASAEELLDLNNEIKNIQKQAIETDSTLLAQLKHNGPRDDSLKSRLAAREVVLKEVLLLNQILVSKAAGVQSLLTHEIKTLHNGMSALGGYRQQQHNHGRIVNSSS